LPDHLPNSWSFRIEEDEDQHPYPPVTVLIHQLTPTSGTLLIGTADRAWFAWWGMLEESITAFLCRHEPPVLLNALWPEKRDRTRPEVASLYRILRAIQQRIVESGKSSL
jgi:hypothetical protein